VEVVHAEDAVVLVATTALSNGRIGTASVDTDEWVVNKTVTGLETDLGLEGVLTYCTNHL